VAFDPRNILVIDFGQLGDVVMSLPALRAIRERFPKAKITVAIGKPGGEIINLSGYADDTLEVDRVALRDGVKLVSIGKIFKLVGDVRKKQYDFVIDLHSLSETNLLGFLSGAPRRLYARRPGRSIDLLANFHPRPPREARHAHAVDRYLDVLKPLGVENSPRLPKLRTVAAADASVEALLKKEQANSGTLLVGVFPGAGHPGRRWPMERFAEVADFLMRNNGVRVIVFAGPEERPLIPQMRTVFPASTIFFDRLTIPQLVSAQARLTLLISNDTGPMHIAAAVGTPVVVIMDRADPHSFIPLGDQHRLVYGGVTRITVTEVYQAALEVLGRSRTDDLTSL
jgi:ADP-heptose:LPS heptosyltransferase